MEGLVAQNIDAKERTSDVRLKESASFNKMLLSESVKKGLTQAGFVCPTVIQGTAIPVGKSGLDLLVQSKSGTGKTIIFSTIILEAYQSKVTEPQALVVAPTRELAVQIEIVLNQIGRYCSGFSAVFVIGGMDVADDRKRLSNARVVVGTPGRLLHVLQNGVLNTTKIKLLVLDEADKLYTQSFRKDVELIQKALPKNRQTIACSATFCNDLDKQLAKTMRNPLLISTDDRATLLVGIKQFVYELPEKKTSILEMQSKLDALRDIFGRVTFQQCLIFAGSQSRADSYRNYLEKDGWPCDLISGAQDQQTRLETFRKFREFKTRILLATDLMARGVDSEHVNLVINLELPTDVVTYLHRIGRAGRFGSHGIAISFVASAKDHNIFKRLISEVGAGMNVLKFPQKTEQETEFDLWDFSDFHGESKHFGLYNIETLAPLASYDKVSLSDSLDDKENIMNNVSVTQSSIDTKTFRLDSKDSAVNAFDLHIEHLEEVNDKSPIHQQDQQTQQQQLQQPQLLTSDSRHSSTQQLPSSNTIDDASSIAADSIRSSQQDISRYQSVFMQKTAIPTLVEYLIDPSSESAKEEDEMKPKQTVDLFEDYTEAVLNNQSDALNKTDSDPAEPQRKPNEQKLCDLISLKSLLIDNPLEKATSETEKHNHLYSDYTNFNEDEESVSTASNTNTTTTAADDIDKATFVLSVATPTRAHESLEELQNSSLNVSQLGSTSETQSAPEKQHFTSPAHNQPSNIIQNVLSPDNKLVQQNLSVNIGESVNIAPIELDGSQSDASSLTPHDNETPASTDSGTATENDGGGGSSGFNEDTNTSESSGIETTESEANSNETIASENSYMESDDDDDVEDDSFDLEYMLSADGDEYDETNITEYSDNDSDSDHEDEDEEEDEEEATVSHTITNNSQNSDYQTAYDRWVHLYWNQLTLVQDYVKLVSYTQQQAH